MVDWALKNQLSTLFCVVKTPKNVHAVTDDDSFHAVQNARGTTGGVQITHEVPADVFLCRCCGYQNQQGSPLLLLSPPDHSFRVKRVTMSGQPLSWLKAAGSGCTDNEGRVSS